MLRNLFNWLFARDDEPARDIQVFDFTTRQEGHDITLRMIDDGEYAEAVIFLNEGENPPAVGDFVVVDFANTLEHESNDGVISFMIETVVPVSLGISQLTLTRYEGAEDA